MLSTEATIVRGATRLDGTRGPYRELVYGPAEPSVRRLELAHGAAMGGELESLLCFVQLTDIHTVDVESPGRFEFMERFAGVSEDFRLVLPAHRAQEALHTHAVDAIIRALNVIERSPATGATVQFVLCTGDLIDNGQYNELTRFLSLMHGQEVRPTLEPGIYRGVQSAAWPNPLYWHPDPGDDDLKREWGFPMYAGLLESAAVPFEATGCRLPWLSCLGNHDPLVLGTALPTAAYERVAVGAEKPLDLPPGFPAEQYLGRFIDEPELFLSGPSTAIPADTGRRPISRREFLQIHATVGDARHGFTAEEASSDRAYYACDVSPLVRLITLDTTNPAGHFQGSLDEEQLCWLERRLIEVHTRYLDREGHPVSGDGPDRLVVISSHHGLNALTNSRRFDGEAPRVLVHVLEALLHRFPNVILWINGHIHRHEITPRPDRLGRTGGFWEVTTASLIDWPSQGRLVDIALTADNHVAIHCATIDHDAHPDPAEAGANCFAALHRELAANDPRLRYVARPEGRPEDRTVELLLPAPFEFRPRRVSSVQRVTTGG